MSIEVVTLSNHLILSHFLLLLPSVFSSIRIFCNESALHIRRPKYWSFSFSKSPFNEYSGLISFKIDWLECLAVLRTIKSLIQYHNSKASILRLSLLYGPTLTSSHDYWKNHRFAIWTFVGKVMSLLFNTLSSFVRGFPGGTGCGSGGKGSACNAWDLGLIPGSGRSSGEVNGNPLQYSCLKNSTDRGAW